ncbi:MAG: mechanosensitive ion channel [Acidimicrobiia bacterium]|nr:mechanosensitive ion channel [Acidimicrobiia bacterium]
MHTVTPTPPPTDTTTTDGGLLEEVENEVKVVFDRWSVGQVDWADVLTGAIVVVAAVAIAWLVRRLIRRSAQKTEGAVASALTLIGQLVSIGIYLFALAIVLEVLGFSLGPVLIVIMLVLVLLFALRPVVQNLSAGLLLQLRGLCHPGDLVEVDGETGVVREVNTRAVLLVTADGRLVSLPNDRVIANRLVNYSREGRRRSNIVVRVPGDTDVESLTTRLVPAMASLEAVLTEPAPQVLIVGFDGREVWVEFRFWHDPPLGAESTARDAVGRLLRDTFDSDDLVLADPSSFVRTEVHVQGSASQRDL